ncbi:OmpA family protein [Pelagibacterales bacterium SAG-MED31]|nr:OmpA family protein [Pelagibacterales bacterium SAG-MED31]
MASRSLRNRLGESTNIWPGFVDVLATLLIVIIFVLMVFTVSQIYLSDAISGRDKALQELRIQISELSKIIQSEVGEKKKALETLSETESLLSGVQTDLGKQELITKGLQTDLAKKSAEIFIQEQNILALSGQITELLSELRIVAKALEVYEGLDTAVLDTEGLGQKINKALATRIDQLKKLNTKLDETNKKLAISQTNLNEKVNELNITNKNLKELNNQLDETNIKLEISENDLNQKINELNITNKNLKELNNQLDETNIKLEISENDLNQKINELNIKNENLIAINESLGLEDGDITEQLQAIKNKNQELLDLNKNLLISQKETQETLSLLEQTNLELSLRDEELQNQISQYQALMNDLLEINDSLGLKDATLKEQLDAIRYKNQELARLNQNLINKDNTIFDLRGKIIELNNVLSISDAKRIDQELEIALLKKNIENIENVRIQENEISNNQIEEMEIQASQTFEQIAILSDEIENLKNEIVTLNMALEASEEETVSKNLEIEILGERLNKALTSKIFELQKYRSEFFGKLQNLLGDRDDIKVVGDRFIFESELLFDSASANLQEKGKQKLKEIAMTLMETTIQIPTDIDWIIQVEGHTDKRPINTNQFPSNWELSTARANSVLKLLLEIGFSPTRLAAAGYGEFYPISDGETKEDYQQNRRIELKLTSR